MNNKLQTITNLFEEKEIRSFWDSEKEEYKKENKEFKIIEYDRKDINIKKDEYDD